MFVWFKKAVSRGSGTTFKLFVIRNVTDATDFRIEFLIKQTFSFTRISSMNWSLNSFMYKSLWASLVK